MSPDATVAAERFGCESQPLVLVDGALVDPGAVVEIAARHAYQPIGPFYPGVRAAVSERIAMPLVAPLMPFLEREFALPRPPRFLECYLSLVTTPADALAPIQRFPHFDGLEPERLAALLYLDAAETGGTAFYRQRTTGFESVDAARFDEYRADLDKAVAAGGLPGAAYIGGDSGLFEQVHRIAGRFNRMAIYRGNALHCADLPDRFMPVADPRRGRLTLNLFLR